ncbi:MAG: xanthine dehydrogenase family protein subunit M [Deltaproteobacteria bacterium]|nr:xanthine dehydrogenase family protein subunit M [Deltaproteobacteria bacterium]
MKSFELHDAGTVEEAVGLLNKFGPTAKALGGGSDLVTGIMKDWVRGKGQPYPEKLVDITTIPELVGINIRGGAATIGAATTLTSIIESEDLKKGWQVLTDAATSVASPLIRNFGTLGGNINQRPRCWFYRGENFDCYKKGGDFCFAVTGDNRYHAIIGGELCYIVHPSDTATALLALNASANVAGPSGRRAVAFDNYFIGPREDVLRENLLKSDELLVNVTIPALAPNTKTAWNKLKDRQVYDFALVSVAAVVTQENGVWKDGRIVLGGVSPVPYRAKVVEAALVGKNIKEGIKAAAATLKTVARPMSLNAYKVDLAINLIERTVLSAL